MRSRQAVVHVLLVAACVAACNEVTRTETGVPEPLRGLPTARVTVGQVQLLVAVADSPAERAQGLAGVDDLGPLDGLLFAFESDVETRFTMRGTLVPLDIAFVASDGRVLEVTTMAICQADPCPAYAPPGPYRWALETPAGGLGEVQPGDLFTQP